MFNLVKSCHGIMHDFTTLDPTCNAAPPIWVVLSKLIIFSIQEIFFSFRANGMIRFYNTVESLF